jgi:hypothetical protein
MADAGAVASSLYYMYQSVQNKNQDTNRSKLETSKVPIPLLRLQQNREEG